MRVLFVNRADAYENYGGDVVQMENTANHLRELGIDLEILLGEQQASTLARYDIVHLFNLQTPQFTRLMTDRAKSAGCKVAVSTIWWDYIADEIMELSPKWRLAKLILGTQVTRSLVQKRAAPHVREERKHQRAILAQADLLLPNSESETAQLRDIGGFTAKVQVVPNGIDPNLPIDEEQARDLLKQHNLKPHSFILIAARVEEVKNQVAFLRAIKSLKVPVVCAGAIREPYGSQCRELGAILLGRLEHPILSGLYRFAKVHALPSFRETPGLASLEAAAAGTPIVSTDLGSAKDYFGNLACYCNPHSPLSMRTATENALAKPRDETLRRLILDRFTWRHAAESTLEGYEQILNLPA